MSEWAMPRVIYNRSVPDKLEYMMSPSPYLSSMKWDNNEQEWKYGRWFILMAWRWLLAYTVTGRVLSHTVPWSILERYGMERYFVTVVAFYWTLLRCCSFSLESIWSQGSTDDERRRRRMPDYVKTLDYALYLPPLFMGPVQNYEDYVTAMEAPKPMITVQELKFLAVSFLRSCLHFLLMDLMLHFFYPAALSSAPYLVRKMNRTGLVGYAIMLHLCFYLKYVVQYGMARSFARIERLELPQPAKCIGRGHLCSHFWRYFDHGLHLWIKKYANIYFMPSSELHVFITS
ncbi:hypothetical protein HPB48_008536 [Haemaphysalis longicornis]|uniref:Uncharacterized protein n=1 Tax=Haemaphysalis longicornis TaxID=44386 RepID=A0A9J6GJ25_HAELO|nr:hypothetical protein HPB48_008536 [Haemaphysalis longicornis]